MCASYYVIVHVAAASGRVGWDPTTDLDRWLPAVPIALMPYLTHVLYYPACVVRCPPGEPGTRALIGLLQTLVQVALISFAVFLFCPAKVDLRDPLQDPLLASHPLLARAFACLHALDPPFNAWPSLHISHTLVALLFIQYYENRKVVRWCLWCAWWLLAASTLLTKQHLVFDGLTGAALGLGAWYWGARRYCRASSSPIAPAD